MACWLREQQGSPHLIFSIIGTKCEGARDFANEGTGWYARLRALLRFCVRFCVRWRVSSCVCRYCA